MTLGCRADPFRILVGVENLVVLAYGSNTCYTKLVKLSDLEGAAKDMNSVDPKNLKLDLEAGTWSYLNWKKIPIGKGRRDIEIQDKRWGIIGVYDHSSYEHVWSIMNDTARAIRTIPGNVLED
jgi:hypothetical protein